MRVLDLNSLVTLPSDSPPQTASTPQPASHESQPEAYYQWSPTFSLTPVPEDALTGNALTEDALTEDALTDEALMEETLTEDALLEEFGYLLF